MNNENKLKLSSIIVYIWLVIIEAFSLSVLFFKIEENIVKSVLEYGGVITMSYVGLKKSSGIMLAFQSKKGDLGEFDIVKERRLFFMSLFWLLLFFQAIILNSIEGKEVLPIDKILEFSGLISAVYISLMQLSNIGKNFDGSKVEAN